MRLNAHAYLELLIRLGVARLVFAAALSRLMTSMFSLSMLLMSLEPHGSYCMAGRHLGAMPSHLI